MSEIYHRIRKRFQRVVQRANALNSAEAFLKNIRIKEGLASALGRLSSTLDA